MKKISLMLLVSMFSMVLPVDLPYYYSSPEAWADDSPTMPSDSTTRHVAPGVPVENFETETGTTGSAVNHMNMLMSIQGPAPTEVSEEPSLRPAKTSNTVSNEASTELALVTPATAVAAAPVVPVSFATPQQIAAAIKAAKQAMEGPIVDFVEAEWTGFSGGLKRPFVKSKIREELSTLIEMVIPTGGTIAFSTAPVATGKNLIVTINYPGGIIFTITISVSPTAGSSPSADDVSKTFTSNVTTVFTQMMIDAFKAIVKVLIGAFSDPPMPPMPVVATAVSAPIAVSTDSESSTSAMLALVPPPPPVEGAETPLPPLDLPDFPDVGESAPLNISDIYLPLFPDVAPGESHPGPTDFPLDLPMPIGPPPGADPPLVPILIGNEPLQLALVDPLIMPIPDAPEDPVVEFPEMPV